MNLQERIAQLEAQIAELEARLPKHSTPPAMLVELEDLEDELESRINSVVSVNTKYRESQDKIDKLNKLFGHEKKEIRHSITLVNELLTKLDLKMFTIEPKLCQKLENVELLALINNAIRAINSKL